MAEAADMGPIQLQLDGHRLTFDHGEWQPGLSRPLPFPLPFLSQLFTKFVWQS